MDMWPHFCLLNKITYTDKMMLVTRQEQYNEKERWIEYVCRKKITRKDVAEKAGVSVSVVSRVLNNSGYVDKEKKKKIIKIAEQLGYIPNPIAMALQTRRTYQIIFFCNDLTGAYYNQMYHGMAKTAKERGYHLLLQKDYAWSLYRHPKHIEFQIQRARRIYQNG